MPAPGPPPDISKMHVFCFFQQCHESLTKIHPLPNIVLGRWWVCFLHHFSRFTKFLFQKARWLPFAVGLIWCAFCSSLWVGVLCFLRQYQTTVSFRYLLLGISEWPSFKENTSLRSVCCRTDSNDLIYQNSVQTIRCRFWKFRGLEWTWQHMVCNTNNKFYWYVLLPAIVCLLTSKLVAFVVQIFYAYKIRLLAKSNFIAMVVVLVNISFFNASWATLLLRIIHRSPWSN